MYKAGDGQDIRFLNKSANFPIHLPESSPSSASAKWPICELWLLETKVLLSLPRTAHNCRVRHTGVLVRSWQTHSERNCLRKCASALLLHVVKVYSVHRMKGRLGGGGHIHFNYSNTCRILQPESLFRRLLPASTQCVRYYLGSWDSSFGLRCEFLKKAHQFFGATR